MYPLPLLFKVLQHFDTHSYFILSSYIFPFIYFICSFMNFPLTPLFFHTCPSPSHLNLFLAYLNIPWSYVILKCSSPAPHDVHHTGATPHPKAVLLLSHCNCCHTWTFVILRQLWEEPEQDVPSSGFLMWVSPPAPPDGACD